MQLFERLRKNLATQQLINQQRIALKSQTVATDFKVVSLLSLKKSGQELVETYLILKMKHTTSVMHRLYRITALS